MDTKYNPIDTDDIFEYFNRLVGKIYKLLPLKEERSQTLFKYHESLMFELTGANQILVGLKDKSEFVSMLCSLESLSVIDDLEVYRRKVFECINIAKKLK